jgi:hypothetical protein
MSALLVVLACFFHIFAVFAISEPLRKSEGYKRSLLGMWQGLEVVLGLL